MRPPCTRQEWTSESLVGSYRDSSTQPRSSVVSCAWVQGWTGEVEGWEGWAGEMEDRGWIGEVEGWEDG